jgi:hypothetical protein
MNALDIVLTVCLLSNPAACQDKTLPVTDVRSLNQCVFSAQPHIAQWSVTHPKYRIVRWRCIDPAVEGEPI